ncbi:MULTISPECIES: hypothetical protein [unclassified Microbacterium]|uniref:hypothetical protein n=1 Tax=unclassified Microbacterium TaxID=2609290 RepID=UPI00386D7FE6
MNPPTVYPGSADVRRSDPLTSHTAADNATSKLPVKLFIERALESAGRPLTADAIWTRMRTEFGYYCSRERVRTVLNEGAGKSKRVSARFNAFVRLDELGESDLGNPSHLWALNDSETTR